MIERCMLVECARPAECSESCWARKTFVGAGHMNEMIIPPLAPCKPINRGLMPDEENLARDMWQVEGKSASEIAAALGHTVTRNAIIGIAHRRGWVGGSVDVRRARAAQKKIGVDDHAARPAPQINRGNSEAGNSSHGVRKRFAPTVPRPVERVLKRSVPIWDLKAHHCKWVKGEPKEFRYCGTRRQEGSPYCARHHDLSYVPHSAFAPKKKAEGFRLPPVPTPNF